MSGSRAYVQSKQLIRDAANWSHFRGGPNGATLFFRHYAMVFTQYVFFINNIIIIFLNYELLRHKNTGHVVDNSINTLVSRRNQEYNNYFLITQRSLPFQFEGYTNIGFRSHNILFHKTTSQSSCLWLISALRSFLD